MGVDAPDLGVDQRWPLAPTGACDSLATYLMAGRDVGAVNGHPGDAVAGRAVGHVRVGHLQPDRNRDRIAVVLADKHDRQAVHSREIHALVELALARGAVTERAQGDAALALELGRIRDAGRLRDPARHHLRDGGDLKLAVAIAAAGDVAAGGKRVTGLGEHRKHPLLHRQAADDRVGQPPVVRHEPVVRPDRRRGGHLDALVAAARADEWSAALFDQDMHPIVERLGHAHPAVEVQVLLACRGGIARRCRHQAVSAFAMSTTSSAVRPIWLR